MTPYLVVAWVLAVLVCSALIVMVWENSGNKTIGWRARRTLLAILGVLAGPVTVPAALACLTAWLLVKACGR